MTKNEILSVANKVHSLKKGKENRLPNNSYFLSENEVLCYPNETGDSRYPYYNDGMVLFAHSSGYIDCIEGPFTIFKPAHYNEDTPVAFFGGEKRGEYYFPISITGAAHQLFEDGVERYVVYTPVCVYYIVEFKDTVYAVKIYINDDKYLRFSVGAVNLGDEKEIYLSSFFEPTLRFQAEGFFQRMTKYGEHFPNGGFVMKSRPWGNNFDCMAVRTKISGSVSKKYFTTAKNTFIGHKGGNLTNALALKKGYYISETVRTNTTDIPIVSDMVHFILGENDSAFIDYEMMITSNVSEAENFSQGEIDVINQDKLLEIEREKEKKLFQNTNITFKDWHNDNTHANVVNSFLKCVQRQVSLCALSKNYAGEYLGIRDVFQQLESALIWQPKEARTQIVKVINLILEDGRAPRQITFPTDKKPVPKMDLRPFIDQGFWIIETLYAYLGFTDDYTILDEICGYFKAEKTMGPLSVSEQRDSLLCHLIKITEFLISNLDEDTHCIHTLFGDWNDALDGLGKTKDKTKEYGNGVSVMATEQLYLSLGRMCEILEKVSYDKELVEKYKSVRETVAKGIIENALVKDQNGTSRIVHGWGEDKSYFVGSYNDYDGKDRISLTAHAYSVISGAIENFKDSAKDIADNILSLDSKYGLLTFDEPFKEYAPEVGRISTITLGTYENSCAYVHAGTFGAMALFTLGYPENAWDALEKAMVITHDKVSLSTFVMPNSYCRDEVYGFDGESMGDWYTGSGTVLIKNIVKYAFGIEPTLNGIRLSPAAYFPAKTAEISLNIKGCKFIVKYENKGNNKRSVIMNGKELDLKPNALETVLYTEISTESFEKENEIVIID